MSVNINVQIVPFGNVIVQIGSPTTQKEQPSAATTHEMHYQEQLKTAQLIYKMLYEQQELTYVAPTSTDSH